MTSNDRGFTLLELLLVSAIIGILSAIAIAGVLRARQSGNEASAIGSIRAINGAQALYASGCARGGYAQSLADLYLEPEGGIPFISPDLAEDGVRKSGYSFSIDDGTDTTLVLAAAATCNESAEDAVATYYVHAEPILVAVTGQRSFGSDHRGTIYEQADGEEVGNTFASATTLR